MQKKHSVVNKKKIGIMTWYKYQNFGTALQSSALYHIIENLDYAPAMIQYEPKGNVKEMNIRAFTKALTKKIKQVFNGTYISLNRDNLYAEYMQNRVTETDKCLSYSELYDPIVQRQ